MAKSDSVDQNTLQDFVDLTFYELNGMYTKPGDYSSPTYNIPDTQSNREFFYKLAQREGSVAKNNPFDTTQTVGDIGKVDANGQPTGSGETFPLPGNTAGVKQYNDIMTGARATALTLTNGHYPDILKALEAGNANDVDMTGGLSQGLTTWSGGAYATLRDVQPEAASKNVANGDTVNGAVGQVIEQHDIPTLGSLTGWEKDVWDALAAIAPRAGKITLGLVCVILGFLILTESAALSRLKGILK